MASPSAQHCGHGLRDKQDKPIVSRTRRSEPAFSTRHHLHWPAHCSADDADDSWLRTRSSIQIHRPLAPLVRSRVNSAIYISSDCHLAGHGTGGGGGAGSARTLAASLLASGLARPWARRARSAENIPLHAGCGPAGGGEEPGDTTEEDTPADRQWRRKRRRGQYEMPVLSVSGPSPPAEGGGGGEEEGQEAEEQHL